MILIGLALAIIASFGLAKILADWDLEGIGIACVIFSSVALVIALIAVPIFYTHGMSEVADYKAFQDTQCLVRTGKTSLGEDYITAKKIVINERLVKARYWNKTIFGIYIPDELAELPYLE